MELPKILVLYDPKQTIHNNFNDIAFYTDFYIDNNFTHYFFDESYRCGQNTSIAKLSNAILNNKEISDFVIAFNEVEKLKIVKGIIDETKYLKTEQIILIHSFLIDEFKKIADDFFKSELEELKESNINIPTSKIRYTTPIKYRGLENKSVYLITNELDEKCKVQNYVAITRAMDEVKIILWKK